MRTTIRLKRPISDIELDIDESRFDSGISLMRWIPISERLPEEFQIVLISTKGGLVTFGYYEDDLNNEWCVKNDYWLRLNDVLAWMPMPEPYKEGEQE